MTKEFINEIQKVANTYMTKLEKRAVTFAFNKLKAGTSTIQTRKELEIVFRSVNHANIMYIALELKDKQGLS